MNEAIKGNPEQEKLYESYLESVFTKDFFDNKEEIEIIADDLGRKKDFKGLCFLLHGFFDTILVEEYIKKGINTKHIFNTYIFMMNVVDKYIELPESYFANKYQFNNDKENIYFNYYIDLRTLIDHSIIPYEDGSFISGKINSWATDLKFGDVSSKPSFFDEDSLTEILNEILGIYNEKFGKDQTDLVYQLIDQYNDLEHYDIKRFNKIEELRKTYFNFEENECINIMKEIIDHDDYKTIIFSLLDLAELASTYPTSFGKYRAISHFTMIYDDIHDSKKQRFVSTEPYDIEVSKDNLPDLVDAYRILCTFLLNYLDASYEVDLTVLTEKYGDIKKLGNDILKVNNFYTDLLGKNFDNFYYSFLQLYFNPGDDIVDFGVFYTEFENNPLNLIWMNLVFYNNVTSQDYAEDIAPLLDKSMESVYNPSNINYKVIMKEGLSLASKLQKNLYNDFIDTYNEIYGGRENPMKSGNFIS